jgi:hypothetical protein
MLKTFKYRLYPTKRQDRLLTDPLEECRWLWNTLSPNGKRLGTNGKKPLTTMTKKPNRRA